MDKFPNDWLEVVVVGAAISVVITCGIALYYLSTQV
jgi:hypothetical protein